MKKGRFHLDHQIGVGGAGRIFAALDQETGKPVAARIFEPKRDTSDLVVPLRRYHRNFSSLSHPAIAPVHNVFVDYRNGYLIRELVDSSPLSRLLLQGPLSLFAVRSLALQVARALVYAYDRDVFHGNLCPANIFLLPDGTVKITDFGLTHTLREEVALPVCGTNDMLYAAPEQFAGEGADHRSDMFALGAVLVQAMTGLQACRLRPDSAAGASMSPVRAAIYDAAVPRSWDDLIGSMLVADPERRFQTPADLESALATLLVDTAPLEQAMLVTQGNGAGAATRIENPRVPSDEPAPPGGRAALVLQVEPAMGTENSLPYSLVELPARHESRLDSVVEGSLVPHKVVAVPRPVRILLTAAASLGGVLAAEIITAYVSPLYGVVTHVGLLVLFLFLGAVVAHRQLRGFFLGMASAPIVRILSLAMPLGSFPQPFWYILTGLPIFAAIYTIARALELSPASLNLRLPAWDRLRIELLVTLSAVGLGMIEWKILRPNPAVAASPLIWLAGTALILLIFTGLLEELLFRGLIQRVSEDLLGPWGGVLVTALLFAILHIGWHSPLDLAFVFAVGLYFSVVVRYTRSLFGVSLAHGVINIMVFLIVPLFLRSIG